MKKFICLMLSIIMCLGLTSCGKKDKQDNVPKQTPSTFSTPEPSAESTPTPTPTPAPTPTPIVEKEFDPHIESSFTEDDVPMYEMTFGTDMATIFNNNVNILTTELTGYTIEGINHTEENSEDPLSVNVKALGKEDSLIDEKIYLAQNPDFISLTFAAKTDKYVEEKDVESYCDTIRGFTGLFLPDIDIYDMLKDTYVNFDAILKFYEKENTEEQFKEENSVMKPAEVTTFDKTLWFTDNTEFISMKINAYLNEENEPIIELYTSFTLHNDDILYAENQRIDFNLSTVRRTNENAFVGTIIGAKETGKTISAMDYIDIIEWPSNEEENNEEENEELILDPEPTIEPTETTEIIDEISIVANSYSDQAYEIPRKETEKGNALDLSALKGTFDLTKFQFSEDKKYVLASSEDGTTTCEIPVAEGKFKIKTDKDFFLEAVQYFTGYNITSSSLEGLDNGAYPISYDENNTDYTITIQRNDITVNYELN